MTKITTGERLMRLETQVTGIEVSIKEHKEEQRKDFDILFKKIDSLENRFASKWVEKVIVGVLITIISSVIGAIIFLI